MINNHYSIVQKGSKKHCEALIISKTTIGGILNPCHDGLWCDFKRSTPTHRNFWFCVDDLTHYVGSIERKYLINKPIVLTIWHVQIGTKLTWDDMITLENATYDIEILGDQPQHKALMEAMMKKNSTPLYEG